MMSSPAAHLNDDTLSWFLEQDDANPGVRYFALRDLLDRDEGDAEVRSAQDRVMRTGAAVNLKRLFKPAQTKDTGLGVVLDCLNTRQTALAPG